MGKNISNFIVRGLAVILLLQSATAHATSNPKDLQAFNYVVNICGSYQAVTFDELKMFGSIFTRGLITSFTDPEQIPNRFLLEDNAPEALNDLIRSEGFIKGIYVCHPHSENRRNLLALRIILLNSAAVAAGDVGGMIAIFKVFSIATRSLGSSAAWALSKMGLSPAAIKILGKLGVSTGYTALGLMTVQQVGQVIQIYELSKAYKKNVDESKKEEQELSELEQVVLSAIANNPDAATLNTLNDQLIRIQKLKNNKDLK